jgi:hypothetical protein
MNYLLISYHSGDSNDTSDWSGSAGIQESDYAHEN